MKRFLTDRVDALGALGQAGLDLLRAEGAALGSELKGSGRRLVGALLFLALALFVAFWAIGALVFSAVEIASLWLPRWGAALAVLALLVVLAAILAAIAKRRLERLETPTATVRRRADEVQEWWERRIAPPTERQAAGGGERPRRSPRAESP